MFKIIGADQKEYGPVSEAQIRQWISDGRLNATSRAQRATGGDWLTLAEFPEFADVFRPAGATAPPPGAAGAPSSMVPPNGAPIPTASREMALSAVKGPAIALMITAGLGIIYYLFSALLALAGRGSHYVIPPNAPPATRAFLEGMHGPGAGIFSFFIAVLNGLVLFGALKMLKLQAHTLAVVACIVAMIPCTTGLCCVLGLPFGIWGIVMLNKPEVKSQFSN